MSGSLIPIARPSGPLVCPGHWESVSDDVDASKIVTAGNFGSSLVVTLPENSDQIGTPIFVVCPLSVGAVITIHDFAGDPYDTIPAGQLTKYDWDGANWNGSNVLSNTFYSCPDFQFDGGNGERAPGQKVTVYNDPSSHGTYKLPAETTVGRCYLIAIAAADDVCQIVDQSDTLIWTLAPNDFHTFTWNGSTWSI